MYFSKTMNTTKFLLKYSIIIQRRKLKIYIHPTTKSINDYIMTLNVCIMIYLILGCEDICHYASPFLLTVFYIQSRQVVQKSYHPPKTQLPFWIETGCTRQPFPLVGALAVDKKSKYNMTALCNLCSDIYIRVLKDGEKLSGKAIKKIIACPLRQEFLPCRRVIGLVTCFSLP